MNLKNNLFTYATKELSQDAFLCWLASYALEDAEPDDALRSCAREMLELFVPELKGRPFTLQDVERQAGHIDVLLTAELAGTTYKSIVEDKTYTREHSEQLMRYKEEIQKKFPGCIPCGVYYKTGFQSDLSAVHEAKYQYVSLEKMLDLLGRYVEKTDSQILRDYYGYWNTYLENARRYRELPPAQWGSDQCTYFFDVLQNGDFLKGRYDWLGYGYVANQTGGFQGIWLGPENDRFDVILDGSRVTCALYVQVESVRENGVRTFPIRLKLEPKTPVEPPITLKKLRNAVLYDEKGKYLPGDFGFQKPSRLGSGRTMTVAEYATSGEEPQTSAELRDLFTAAYENYLQLLHHLQNIRPQGKA